MVPTPLRPPSDLPPMSKFLLIETSTALCSVALAEDGRVTAFRESAEPRAHAAMTAPYVQEVLQERGLRAADLDAVCVSAGPGSYTGLRVGVSTAKGICFAAGVPLLSVGTLELLVHQARAEGQLPAGCKYVIPMIDARRMEVYAAVFTPEGERLTDVAPQVIDAESFRAQRTEGPMPIQPASGASSPVIRLTSVDFPLPLSPMTAMRSCPSTTKDRSENSVRSPKLLLSPSAARTSSPEKSRSLKRTESFFCSLGFSERESFSMRFSIEKARLWSLSFPIKAHRCICSAARASCSSLA